ncbi:sugar transferase [Sphingomonas oligophenolica]|uniref:Sugar transferase n=1 Tax=Sphingomonas oligophenolica TaxID=301154 RepID=A0ABU9YC01_9SPHN
MQRNLTRLAGNMRWISSLRVQLFAEIVLGVFVPLAARFGIQSSYSQHPSAPATLVLTFFSVVSAMLMSRRIGGFPGARTFIYVLPTFSMSFGLAMLAALVLRLDYNRTVLVASFTLSVAGAYALAYLSARGAVRRFHVVPGGAADSLYDVDGAQWLPLAEPAVPPGQGVMIVADLHHDLGSEWERMLARAAIGGIPVYHVKQIRELLTGRVQIDHLSENSFGSLLPNLAYRKFKRLIDVGACLLVLPFLAITTALIAICIRLDSPGPIFFRQQRMGYRGRSFTMIKFRSMTPQVRVADGDARINAITQTDDDRITRVGRFLRRTRLDELPQILNILAGEMSWIGPRPEAMDLSIWYEAEIPFYSYRHIVRPGITGWAQVNQGHVADLAEINMKLQYDFFYVKNFSAWLDVLITMRTVVVMINGFGSK